MAIQIVVVFLIIIIVASGSNNAQQQQEFTSFDLDPTKLLEDPLGSLTKGWSFFKSNATTALTVVSSHVVEGAKMAACKNCFSFTWNANFIIAGAELVGHSVAENIIKPTAEKMRDPDLSKNVGDFIGKLGQKVRGCDSMF